MDRKREAGVFIPPAPSRLGSGVVEAAFFHALVATGQPWPGVSLGPVFHQPLPPLAPPPLAQPAFPPPLPALE